MKYGKWFVGAMMFAVAGVANADNCNHPRDNFDGIYCLNKVYSQADRDLNQAYRDLRHRLKAPGRRALKRTQLGWIKTRNRLCSWSGPRGFFVNLRCATGMTIKRTDFLTQRIRECKATGCQPGKIQ